jgi:hypothetical protein
LRYKTLRNVQKRKRDRKHIKPRKIRFLLKGGQEDQTTTGIELTQLKKEPVPKRKSNAFDDAGDETKDDAGDETKDDAGDETDKKPDIKDLTIPEADLTKPLLRSPRRIYESKYNDDDRDETKEDIPYVSKNNDDRDETKEEAKRKEEEAKRKAEEAQPLDLQATSTIPPNDDNVDVETKIEKDDDYGPEQKSQSKEVLERLKRFQLLKTNAKKEIPKVAPPSDVQATSTTPKGATSKGVTPKVVTPPSYVQTTSTTPSTEPVRTTMSTDENDDYKIITVKVYYPKKALANVISDSGNSAVQTLDVLSKQTNR